MRILFFPSDLGGGFGHISRCLTLAHKGKSRGHNCGFVFNTDKYANYIGQEFGVYLTKIRSPMISWLSSKRERIFRSESNNDPLFIEFSSLAYQAIRDGLVTEKSIKNKLRQYLKIVEDFKPDVLIGDANLLVWMLSKKANVPVVQIVRFASHPSAAKLIWWKKNPEGLTPPDFLALFNPLLRKMRLEAIEKAEDLLRGDLFIVPSIPAIEPIQSDEATVHVGELARTGTNDQYPSWLEEIDDSHPLIYVTIGGGAGSVGNKLFFSTVAEAFADKPYTIIVSTSRKFDLGSLPDIPKNIRFYQWVPGKLLISKANLVVFHGGYGTMMECLSSGKPTITIPYHSEQEGNGRRMEQLGCGSVLKLSKETFKRMEKKWRFGSYSFLVQNRYDLTAKELSDEVSRILANKGYLKNAQNLQSRLERYGGPKAAIQLIEKSFS
jgi:MGT family glycosyltransferase